MHTKEIYEALSSLCRDLEEETCTDRFDECLESSAEALLKIKFRAMRLAGMLSANVPRYDPKAEHVLIRGLAIHEVASSVVAECRQVYVSFSRKAVAESEITRAVGDLKESLDRLGGLDFSEIPT